MYNYFPLAAMRSFEAKSAHMPEFAGHVPDVCRTSEIYNSLFLNDMPDMPDMPDIFRARTCKKFKKPILLNHQGINFFLTYEGKKCPAYPVCPASSLNSITYHAGGCKK